MTFHYIDNKINNMDFIKCNTADELMYGSLEVTTEYFMWLFRSIKQGNSN